MFQPGLRRYAVIPLLINVALFSTMSYYAIQYFEVFLDWSIPDWLDWSRYVLWPIFAIALLLGGFYLFSLLANLVAAPFNAMLATRLVNRLLPDSGLASQAPGLWKDISMSIASEIRKIRYQLIWMIPLLILMFIPGPNLLAPLAWFIFGAWMMAIEYLDYPLGAIGLSFPQQRRVLRKHRRLSTGFGATILFLSAVPLLNFIVIPAAVAGASKLYAEHLHQPERSMATD